jgi:recombinational DNA repair protein RecT
MDPSAPDLKDEDIVGGYAVAELVNGQRIQLWMSRAQIEKRRAASQAPSGNFWTKWYPEMVRKTLLRALFAGGLVPMSSELALAIEADVDMAYQPYDAPPVKTAAQRRIGAFTQVIEQEQLPASDTVAEVVSEWSKVRALAEDYQPTTEQIDGAASVLSLSIDRETWTKEQADAWLSELELALGVN